MIETVLTLMSAAILIAALIGLAVIVYLIAKSMRSGED